MDHESSPLAVVSFPFTPPHLHGLITAGTITIPQLLFMFSILTVICDYSDISFIALESHQIDLGCVVGFLMQFCFVFEIGDMEVLWVL